MIDRYLSDAIERRQTESNNLDYYRRDFLPDAPVRITGLWLNDAPQLESALWVDHINGAYASLFTAFVAHTNRVGFEDGLNFWGGAAVYDPNGDAIAHGPYHEEALTQVELDLNQLHRTRSRLPLLRDERTALVLREMQRILGS